MNDIDWHGEAMEFSKEHNQNRDVVVQLIEKAMRRGAELIVEKTTNELKLAADQLEKQRRSSVTENSGETKLIEINL